LFVSDPFLSEPSRRLSGKRFILTAPEDPNLQRLQSRLVEQGGETVHVPLIAIHPMPLVLPVQAIASLTYDWLFFTSKNGVHNFFKSPASDGFKTVPMAVVGPATAKVLQSYGLQPAFVSPRFDAESAAEAFTKKFPARGLRILWPCGNQANRILATTLMEKGASVLECPIYETRFIAPHELSTEAMECLQPTSRANVLSFTSPSAVLAYEHLFPGMLQAMSVTIASLGPKTTEALQQCGISPTIVPQQSTFDGLFEAIMVHFNEPTP
jgi:uroporphyrinogen-III synthase